eukprot:m.76026 g.76026  ORF g.76026 m.76026 type:complete len:606 (-) comp14420_c0_seq1:134-1951(-)
MMDTAPDLGNSSNSTLPQGCEHVTSFKQSQDGASGTDNLATALTYLWMHQDSVHTCMACTSLSEEDDSAKTSTIFEDQTHLCLSCVFVGCLSLKGGHRHAKSHADQAKHPFSIHCAHRQVYCHICQDYVYDPAFEHILRVQQAYEIEAKLPRDPTRLTYEPWQLQSKQASSVVDPSAPIRSSLYTPGFGLRGLANLGNTCFANSVLQCLLHNPILRNFFLSDLHRKSSKCSRVHEPKVFEVGQRVEALYGGRRKYFPGQVQTVGSSYTIAYDDGDVEEDVPREHIRAEVTNQHVLCLACVLNEIFSTAYDSQKDQISTHMLLYSVWKSSANLAGYSQQDAHEFFITLLDGLHQHLTKDPLQPQANALASCKCIIHRIFTGKLQSDVRCSSCQDVSTTIDPFWDLSLGIWHPAVEAVASSTPAATPSLLDCLQAFTKSELLGEDALVNCERCGSRQQAVKRLTLRSLPVVLCFHLKRFHQTSFATPITKDQSYVRFDEYLDLRPYLAHTVSTSQAEDGTQASSIPDDAFDYTLFGVVTHIGTMQQGHYIAYVKQQDQWYKCDDATITMASRAEVLSTQAYLLFYIKSRLEYHTTETMADPDEGPST